MNGPTAQENYRFAQKGQKFAEGYYTGESMGSNLTMNGPTAQENYRFSQKGHKFAEGFGDREVMGETIRSNGPEKFITTNYVQTEDPVSW